MVFIKRDEQGKICAVFAKPPEEGLEEKQIDDAELTMFLANCDERWELLQSDFQLIRVIEDLVEILMEKNLVTITDFPAAAIEKLVSRRGVRDQLSNAGGLLNQDEENEDDV